MSEKKHFRYFSINNPWMDCVITVSKEDADKAKEIITRAMNDWWDYLGDEGLCYGEAIEMALTEFEILYNIKYHDANIDPSSSYWEEYEENWESIIPKDCEII